MVEIILSIKPKWAEKIYSGEKRLEYRKSSPKVALDESFKAYMYESGSGLITGEVIFSSHRIYSNSDCYDEILKGCVDLDDLNDYWNKGNGKLHCWRVGRQKKYEEPVRLYEAFSIKRPPLSWIYNHYFPVECELL